MLQVQSIALDRALLQLLDSSKVGADLRALFQVGKTLEVEVRQNQLTGQMGLGVNGQFVPADLPETVSPGDRLSVEVVKSSDAIVLRILQPGRQSPAKLEATITLDNLLKSILSENQLDALRQIPRLLSREARIAFPDVRNLAPEGGETVKPGSAADTLAKIATSGLFVREEELDAPEKLEASLARIGTEKILSGLSEAKSAIRQLARDPSNELRLTLLGAIDEQIDFILESTDAPSFETPVARSAEADKALTNAIKLTLAISRYAQETGNLVLVNKIARDLGGLGTRVSPLGFLLESLFNLESLKIPVQSEADRALTSLVKELTESLSEHRDAKSGEGPVRETLVKSKLAMREAFGDTNAKLKEEVSVRAAANAMQSLEAMASAQDVLNRINPVVQALGEPAPVLVPALLQGIFNRWDILVPPRVQEEESEEKGGSSGGSRETFERLSVVATLPALGDVRVDLAHRTKEILISITVAEEAAAEFVRSKLSLLETRLRSNGFEKTSLSAVKGEVRDAAPGWYRDLVKQGVMA